MTIKLDFLELILACYRKECLKKLVFSKPNAAQKAQAVKVSGRLCAHRGQKLLALEYALPSSTVAQRNLRGEDEMREALLPLFDGFGQVNLLTAAGDAELRANKDGRVVALGADKLARRLAGEAAPAEIAFDRLEREKKRLLTGREDFLIRLGVSDASGRVHDKKQGKFRQINRFLEYLEEIYPALPQSGKLSVYDLCCGKSYLSFAVYYALTERHGREVDMLCVDLKRDVIDFCEGEARALGYGGMRFEVADIRAINDGAPDLVVSLHACDIATDVVLDAAVRLGAKVILSTPCCHRYLNGKLTAAPLSFVTDHPQIANKLCEALTDGLRLLRLKAAGYDVSATELVDPEDTPKNTLLRAIKRRDSDPRAAEEYREALGFLLGGRAEDYLSEIRR